ncbi:UNVERIFIED_CONTAM: hypothetical protein Slati_2833500 [Sesamum latifolium]|uniref:Lipid droplet-associated hydrolase n=1 Tax=Sesamum latifolium TaxID=2727402 RepID=A0AAW2VEN7_9LAMI
MLLEFLLGILVYKIGSHEFAHDADCFLLVLDEAVGHISHSEKISFIEQELQDVEVPIVLVVFCIGLYPFLALNTASKTQALIRRLAESPAQCAALSFMGGLLGMLPAPISRLLVKKTIGISWSSSAVEVLRTHILQYHTIRNMLFMAMTEFQKLPEKPDWDFIRGKKNQIAFLFGLDDHWGPLHVYEEILKQAPDARLEVEREGHTHAFSCTEAGSVWVAQHVSSSIKSYIQTAKSYQSRI